MKPNLLITGSPGIGKTTLIKKLVDHVKSQGIECSGFYTEEIRNNGTRSGFDIVTLDGERGILARKSSGFETNTKKPKVGQYEVFLSEFEKFALPVFDKPKQLIVIDEIGKMELFSKKFENAVRDIFKNKTIQVIATVPMRGKLNIIEQLKQSEDCQLFSVKYSNRDTLLDDIVKLLIVK